MPSTVAPSLTAEEIDDLIYHARVGDVTALESTITEISTSHSSGADEIVNAAIDGEAAEPESGTGCSLLHWPAANGNEKVLGHLISVLATKADPAVGAAKGTPGLVNHKNRSGNTPLHWAAVNGHISCVKALVAAGGDPAITNNAGHDALYEAECTGKEGGREVAEWLLANCAGLEKGISGQAEGRETTAGQGEKTTDDMVVD